jgi:hypothetical protein
MEAICAFRHGSADKRVNARSRFLLSLLLLSVFTALSFVFAAPAQCSQVIINDLNNNLSADEKASLTRLAEILVLFHRAHSNFKTPVVLNVRLFLSTKAFRAYQKKISDSTSPGGFYSGRKNELVVNGTVKNYTRIILHEAQHAIFSLTGVKSFIWLDEGLSTFFDEAYLDQGVIYIRSDRTKMKTVKRALSNNKLTPLRRLLALPQRAWNGQFAKKDFKYYFEAWSLIFYLMMDKEARQRQDLIMIMGDLRQGSPVTVLQSINRRYPGGIDALERDWRKFIGASNFRQKLRYNS